MNWTPLIILALTVYGFLVSLLLFRRDGLAFKVSELRLPFLTAKAHSFKDISIVDAFNHVSRSIAVEDMPERARFELAKQPAVMIFFGWDIVCSAYISAFGEYPDDGSLSTNATALGGQNIEYIKIFRDISSRVVSRKNISIDFAEGYFSRCPSMSERITLAAALHTAKLGGTQKPYKFSWLEHLENELEKTNFSNKK